MQARYAPDLTFKRLLRSKAIKLHDPTLPTGGCTNGTLTFAALTLRSADHIASSMTSAHTLATRG